MKEVTNFRIHACIWVMIHKRDRYKIIIVLIIILILIMTIIIIIII